MILSVTLSKPSSNISELLDKPYEKIKIKIENSAGKTSYFAEMFTKTQVFHKHFSEMELEDFLTQHAGTTFKNCVKRTEKEEITILANKKGKITTLTKALKSETNNNGDRPLKILPPKKKNYLLEEGKPVPFLVLLGIMNADGKVINSKYDKFRQINRFLEFIDDVLPEIKTSPVRIADFGCGKSYLTFAVHYYLTEIKKIPCQIEGLDLKQEVIDYCNEITRKLGLEGLIFHTGNIADYSGKDAPHMVITLHACDTATDYALKYAVEKNAKVILSVPCCQHQVNTQLGQQGQSSSADSPFEPLLKWGLIREKFSSLVTDALRGEYLENQGYKVQMMEFIDIEHTPKNILIRAVKTNKAATVKSADSLMNSLGIKPEIWN